MLSWVTARRVQQLDNCIYLSKNIGLLYQVPVAVRKCTCTSSFYECDLLQGIVSELSLFFFCSVRSRHPFCICAALIVFDVHVHHPLSSLSFPSLVPLFPSLLLSLLPPPPLLPSLPFPLSPISLLSLSSISLPLSPSSSHTETQEQEQSRRRSSSLSGILTQSTGVLPTSTPPITPTSSCPMWELVCTRSLLLPS